MSASLRLSVNGQQLAATNCIYNERFFACYSRIAHEPRLTIGYCNVHLTKLSYLKQKYQVGQIRARKRITVTLDKDLFFL